MIHLRAIHVHLQLKNKKERKQEMWGKNLEGNKKINKKSKKEKERTSLILFGSEKIREELDSE